jgi:hypothetical protein
MIIDIIDLIDADLAASAPGACASGRRRAASHGTSYVRRRRDLAPDKPSRFKYTSASIEPQRVARVA